MSARSSAAFVLLGVTVGNVGAASGSISGRVVVPLVWLGLWSLRGNWHSRQRVTALLILSTAVGVASVTIQQSRSDALERAATEVPRCVAEGIVLESRKGLGTFGKTEVVTCDDATIPGGVIVFEGDQAFTGSPFALEGILVPLGSSGFDRARYDAGASAAMTGRPLLGRPKDPFRGLAYSLREDLTKAASVLPMRESALLTGLTIGDTSRMSEVDEEIYRDTGLAHLVAVSGSNIAIVVGTVLLFLGRSPLFVRLGGAAVVLALYVTIVGPDASVLRAAAMGVIALAALAFGRRHEVLSALAYALAALIVLRPEMISSLGLQLSAAATAGLALWSGPLAARFHRLPPPIAFALGATVAAQVAVAPLLVFHFERLSLVGPLANILALPAVAAATLIGLSGGILGAVWLPLGEVVMRVALPFVWWIVRVADVTATPAWSSVGISAKAAWPLAIAVLGAALWASARRRGMRRDQDQRVT